MTVNLGLRLSTAQSHFCSVSLAPRRVQPPLTFGPVRRPLAAVEREGKNLTLKRGQDDGGMEEGEIMNTQDVSSALVDGAS